MMCFSRSTRWLVMAALVAAMVLASSQSARAEETKRIGVVNVARVFAGYQKVKDIQNKMEAAFKADRDSIEAESRKLQEQEARLQADPRPNDNREKVVEIQKFQLAKFDLEAKFKELSGKVEARRKDEMKVVLNDIKNAIREVGQSQRFDMVMRAPEFDEDASPAPGEQQPEARSAAELVRKFRENPVLFFSPGIDITDKVLAKLNADYTKSAP